MRSRTPLSPVLAVAAALVLLLVACGASGTDAGSAGDRPTIVATTEVLGAVTAEVVGDAAEVVVLIPSGADPHEFRPSARDLQTVTSADLIVRNGLDLEESLDDALSEAESAGVPIFTATDHLEVRRFGAGEIADEHAEDEHAEDEHAEDEHADDEHADEPAGADDHAAEGAEDPHFWVDPLAMQAVVAALAPVLDGQLGLDVGARAAAFDAELAALDADVAVRLAVIPPERRLLVTGHESLGYYAQRYDLRLVGAIIPSLSTQASASAGELAALRDLVVSLGVPAIFTELGTPAALADTIASETGVPVIELPTHTVPADGGYAALVEAITDGVVRGLAP